MSVSRAETARAVALSLALGLLALPAAAQSGRVVVSPEAVAAEPDPGADWESDSPPAADPVATPLPAAPAAPLEGWATGPQPRPGRIEVGEIKPPDREAVGLLDQRQGGLGPQTWAGSNAATVRRLLPLLPAAPASDALRGLERRLLLSAAPPPEGAAGLSPSLLELRARTLFAMGALDELSALLRALPGPQVTPTLAQIAVDSALLLGDAKGACAQARLRPETDPRIGLFCALSEGRIVAANMTIDLLRERKDSDRAFLAAADAMAGTPPPRLDKIAEPAPIHLAAFRAAKIALPVESVALAHPGWARAFAEGEANPPELRLVAAERAEATGAYDGVQLRRIYDTLAGEAGAKPPAETTPRGRALAWRAAAAEQQPAARAALIARALSVAAERGALAGAARLYAPMIGDLRPAPDTAPFAADFTRALLAAGRVEAAAPWLALARSAPEAGAAVRALDPLARLAGLGANGPLLPVAPDGVAPDLWAKRTLLLLALYQGLGERIAPADWAARLDAPPLAATLAPRPAFAALARDAAQAGRKGETVLLALVTLGETPLDRIDPDLIGQTLARLRASGLEREARSLAVEAALAAGW